MIFYERSNSNINTLVDFFHKHTPVSGHHINPQKSTIYGGSIATHGLNSSANTLGFKIGNLPFIYLGVPILKDRFKIIHLQPIIDNIKIKLVYWKVTLLFFA